MTFLTKLLVLIQFILNLVLVGFIFIKPYILDDVFTENGTKLNFKGVYDNPIIYFIIFIGFVLSFYLFIRIILLFINKNIDINTNINLKLEKKWFYYTTISILLFALLSFYHNTFVKYSIISPDYKAEIQNKMREVKK